MRLKNSFDCPAFLLHLFVCVVCLHSVPLCFKISLYVYTVCSSVYIVRLCSYWKPCPCFTVIPPCKFFPTFLDFPFDLHFLVLGMSKFPPVSLNSDYGLNLFNPAACSVSRALLWTQPVIPEQADGPDKMLCSCIQTPWLPDFWNPVTFHGFQKMFSSSRYEVHTRFATWNFTLHSIFCHPLMSRPLFE